MTRPAPKAEAGRAVSTPSGPLARLWQALQRETRFWRGVIYDADAVDATLRILEQVILDPQSGHGIMIARPDGDGGQDAPLAA